jgi:hypothetical protein
MAVALVLAVPAAARAYIEALMPLQQVFDESTHIYTAKFLSVDKVKQRASIKLLEPIKGKTAIQKLNFDIKRGQYPDQIAFLPADIEVGRPAIFCWQQEGDGSQGGNIKGLLYSCGYFTQYEGGYEAKDIGNIWLNLTHIEIKMGRTYTGPTLQLITLLKAHAKDKKPLPAPKPQVADLAMAALRNRRKEAPVDLEDAASVKAQFEAFAAAAAAVPKPQLGSGTGLKAEYYDTPDFTSLKVTRIDPQVKFTFAGEAAPGVAAETFSVRWTGTVQPKYSGAWTFYTRSDDGVRLWVDGKPLVNNWTDHGATVDAGTIELKAGRKYEIKMEYYQGGGEACAFLEWSCDSQEQEVIPASQLYPPAVPAAAGTPALPPSAK